MPITGLKHFKGMNNAKFTKTSFHDLFAESCEIPKALLEQKPLWATLADVFDRIDTDKDGQLSLPDIIAFWRITRKGLLYAMTLEHMASMDTNKDGKVSSLIMETC